MDALWRIEMLGALRLRNEESVIERFRTRRVAFLLAFLAYYCDESHSRAEVSEMLWPEADAEKQSTGLRQALASLRRQIEPAPLPAGSVLQAHRLSLQILPSAILSDVREFEQAILAANAQTDPMAAKPLWERAVKLYRGPLLPGYEQDWIARERLRLEDLYTHALKALADVAQEGGQVDRAVDALHLAIARSPYDEELHAALMRMYLDSERPTSALEHYQVAIRRLKEDLGLPPSEELRALARQARGALPEATHLTTVADHSSASASTSLSRLPVQLTRLFGRYAETEALLVDFMERQERFVTLLGPPGIGKTTLALTVARRLVEFGWNVSFTPLADLNDAAMVLDAIADAMKTSREMNGGPMVRIRSGMSADHNLLVLDNAEHLVEGLAEVVAILRREIPSLAILVTSRHSLRIADERIVQLSLLEVPPAGEKTPDELAQNPSVALLVDRARMLQPDFTISPRNAEALAEICKQLDGLPLAIELAAGLIQAFTPGQILAHLNHRFAILRTRRRDTPERHRSLEVALDYSYEFLTDAQKVLFCRLSVFVGGFSLPAIAAIFFENDLRAALAALLELQDRSLLSSDPSGGSETPRFRMLESFRQYGLERMSPDERDENAQRHACYYANLLSADFDRMSPSDQRRYRLSLLQEGGNAWCTILRLLSTGHADAAVGMIAVLVRSFPYGVPRKAEYDVLSAIDPMLVSFRSRALMELMRGQFELRQNIDSCMARLEHAVDLAREIGDPLLLIHCLTHLGVAKVTRAGPAEALKTLFEILPLSETPEGELASAYAFNAIATCHWMLGEIEASEVACHEGLRRSRETPGEEVNWVARHNLAQTHAERGELEMARIYAGDVKRIGERLNDPLAVSTGNSMIAWYREMKGDLEGAREMSLLVLAQRRAIGLPNPFANSLRAYGVLISQLGETEKALVLIAATERYLAHLYYRRHWWADALEKLKGEMSEVIYRKTWENGLNMTLEEAHDFVR